MFRSQAGHVLWHVSASASQQRHRSHTRRRNIDTGTCYAPYRYGAYRYARVLRFFIRPCPLTHDQIGASTASSASEVQGKSDCFTCLYLFTLTLPVPVHPRCRHLSASTSVLSARDQPNKPHCHRNDHRVARQSGPHHAAQMARPNNIEVRQSSRAAVPSAETRPKCRQ
jgi:hypothetical protein